MHEQTTDKIAFRLIRTSGFFTRWPCHICGGETGNDAVLGEAASPFSDHGTLRICPQCLQCRNFDHLLEQHAQGLESRGAAIRSLIGRIEAPSFAEWEREENAAGRDALGPLPDDPGKPASPLLPRNDGYLRLADDDMSDTDE